MEKAERREIEHEVYVSLREHFNALKTEQDRRIEQAFTAARDAVSKAETAQERRIDLLNEFRAQSVDEGRKYAMREVVEPRLAKVEARLDWMWGAMSVLAIIGVANLVKLFLG